MATTSNAAMRKKTPFHVSILAKQTTNQELMSAQRRLRTAAGPRLRWLRMAALLCCIAWTAASSNATPREQSFSFALMGDMPYSDDEAVRVADLLQAMNALPLEFVVHIGDIKSGYSVCDDETLQSRFALFSQSRHPLMLTPGDNDWLDCQRWFCGGYDPLERLARLRQIFYPPAPSDGQDRLLLERQSDSQRYSAFRENARWQKGGVVFVTINVPGGNNNLGNSAQGDAEYRARGAANTQWLNEAFALARQPQMRGLAIFFQANPRFGRKSADNGYRALIEQLASQTLRLKKPVLVAHGDTHTFRIDRPLRDPRSGRRIVNLQRVETFGSPFIDWVKITVDPDDRRVFRIRRGSEE